MPNVITQTKLETYFKVLTIEELKAGSTGSYGRKELVVNMN